MARGKHRKRAEKRTLERQAAMVAAANERLAEEESRRREAEIRASRVEELVAQIGVARRIAEETCAEEVAQLEAEIQERFVLLAEIMAAGRKRRSDSNKLLGAQVIFGQGSTSEVASLLIQEVERRMIERYPDDYAPGAEDAMVLMTVPRNAGKKIGREGIAAVEKARARKGSALMHGNWMVRT